MRLIPQSAFSRVLWGLGLGIFCGVFFGEPAGKLEIVGQAYIRLLQITVLPYILVSLIGGLGRLDADIARRIGAVGGMLILLIWGLTQVSNLLLPLVYPEWKTAPASPMTTENVTNRTVKAPPKTGQNAAPGGISRPQLALWSCPVSMDT